MAVGLGQDAGSVNSWAYQVSLGLKQSFDRAIELQAFINQTGAAALEAAPYSFSAADVATLTSAINDVVTLSNIFNGTAAQGTTPQNFDQFLKLLRGVGCW